MNKNENQADTFRRLVTPYLNTLYKTAFRLTGSNEQAEDLVQDLLVKLYPKTSELENIRHAGIDFLVSPELAFVFYGQYRKSYYPDKNTPADEKREDDRVLISRGGNTSYSSPLMPFCSTPVLTTIPACLNTATKAIVSCWD
ncbi:MAG: RNA polymerase sigma factor [Desulfobacterales bacterium]